MVLSCVISRAHKCAPYKADLLILFNLKQWGHTAPTSYFDIVTLKWLSQFWQRPSKTNLLEYIGFGLHGSELIVDVLKGRGFFAVSETCLFLKSEAVLSIIDLLSFVSII